MRKYFYLFCSIVLVCTLLAGCGTTPTNSPSGTQRQPLADSVADDVMDDSVSFIYTTEDHIIPMSKSVTADGITYQVLACEVTSEFGNRKLENLNYFFADGGVDDEGNLTKDRCYVFLTIQFANTTDSEVEILRNDRGIYFMDEHFIIDDYSLEAVYIDEYWLGGTSSEIYHYKLAPGESITSEVGWIVSDEAIQNHDRIYYAVRLADCITDFGGATDPDAIFIDLEYESA